MTDLLLPSTLYIAVHVFGSFPDVPIEFQGRPERRELGSM